jgi:hypothetical protein
MVVSSFAQYSALKMKAMCSFETSVVFQRITRLYIPEDRNLHNHGCENLSLERKINIDQIASRRSLY